MLIKQTLLYMPAQVLSPLVQFASILVWSHLLQPADLGVVTLLVAMQEVCYMAFFGWWSLSTIRFIGTYTAEGERPAYLRTETAAVAASIVAQTLVMLVILPRSLEGRMTPLLLSLSLVFMLSRSINYYNADRARAEARIMLYSLVQLVGPVIGFAFGLVCIWYYGSTPAAVLGGFVLAQTIGILLGLTLSDFCHGFGRTSSQMLKRAVTFGGPAMSAQGLAVVAINAPRFIVSHVLGLSALGMFSVGYSLGIRASSFAVSLVSAGAYPLVVRKMRTEGKEGGFRQLSQNMTLVALSVMPVAVGLLAINRSFVHLLVDPKFQAVTLAVLPLSTLGGMFRYLRAHTSDQVFLLSLRPEFSTLIAVSDLIVAIASAYIGVRLFGVVGAASGPMISGLVTLTLSFILSRFVFGYHAPFLAFFRILLSAAAMGVAIYLLPIANHAAVLFAYIAFGGLIYAGAVMFAMPKEARILLDMIGRRRNRAAAATGG